MSRCQSFARIVGAIILILTLASCAGLQPGVDTEQTVQQANQLRARGQSKEAAAVYWQAAAQLEMPQRAEFRLRAVEMLLAPETRDQARAYLAQIDAAALRGDLRARRQLAEARLALLFEQPKAALAALPDAAGRPPLLQRRILEARAQALAATGHILEAVKDYIALDMQMTEPGARQANQQALWEALATASPKQLQAWNRRAVDPALKGWLELAYINKSAPPTLDELNRQLDAWRLRHPRHAAIGVIPARIRADWRALRLSPQQIAVMLPLTGPYADVARAVLDGIMAAYYRDVGDVGDVGDAPASDLRPIAGGGLGTRTRAETTIRVYDVGDQAGTVKATYRQAVDAGADLVIGPLEKDAVEVLARAAPLPVPVIALNYIEDPVGEDSGEATPGEHFLGKDPRDEDHVGAAPGNLYQFGLLPEDEARQVAERASLEGHDYAIAFVPYGDWGDRLLQAFRTRFEKLGGTVVASQRYDTGIADYAEPIREAFSLGASEARHAALEGLLRRNLEFTPRRRQDADFIFLAATSGSARLLSPQFNYHYGLDLPVYATSHVFSGVIDARADKDMNGIIYSEVPWMLPADNPLPEMHQRLDTLFPQSNGQLPRLVALGIDAYRVIPYLKLMAARPYERFTGVTGMLRLDASGRIHRQLNWAQFVEGQPQAIAAAPMQAGPLAESKGRAVDVSMDNRLDEPGRNKPGDQESKTPRPPPGQ